VMTSERVHLGGLWLHGVQFAITFAIAALSYQVLERPIRTRGVPFGRPAYVAPLAVALSVLLVVRGTHARPVVLRAPPEASIVPAALPIAPPEAPPATPFRLLLLGDSTANSLGWGLRGVRRPGVVVDLLGKDGCTMLADTCGGSEWAREAMDKRPDAILVVLGGAFLHGLTIDGQWRKACHRGWDSKFQSTLTRRLGDLEASSSEVWAVTVPYAKGPWDSSAFRTEVDCINRSIRKAAQSVAGVRTLDLAERLCPKGVCEEEFEGVPIRPDGAHFSVEGALGLSRWVLEQVEL
jgi:hypothetical protein